MEIKPGKYRTRGGFVAEVERAYSNNEWVWAGSASNATATGYFRTWTKEGFAAHGGAGDEDDLIECIEEKPAFAVGQVWRTRGGEERTISLVDSTPTKYPIASQGENDLESWHWPDGRCCVKDLPQIDLIEFVSGPVPADYQPPSIFEKPITADRIAQSATNQLVADAVSSLPFAPDEIEAEPDNRESAEVLAAALRILLATLSDSTHSNEVVDGIALARLALETHAP